MLNYDPRKISIKVYINLKAVKDSTQDSKSHDKQRNQAIELYSYIATWGLLRLKGEEPALVNEAQKQKVVERFFTTLGELVFPNESPNPLKGTAGITKLTGMTASEYLGITGVALQVAREFSFWAESLYAKPRTNNAINQGTTEQSTARSN
jgi:hypothetical protein